LQQKLTYLAYRFAPVVHGIKNIVAYHAGDGVWAEYDVLFEENTPLYRAHDVAETLQYCCEGMTEVDRAFVTTDCEYYFALVERGWTLIRLITQTRCRIPVATQIPVVKHLFIIFAFRYDLIE